MSKYLCLASLLLAVATVDSYFENGELSSKSMSYGDYRGKDFYGSYAKPDGYRPVKGFAVLRHGVNPLREDKENVGKVRRLQQLIKASNVGTTDLSLGDWLNWNATSLDINNDNQDLLPKGKEEMEAYAVWLRKGFPELFEDSYNAQQYPVLASAHKNDRKNDDGTISKGENRAAVSAAVFMEALFPGTGFTPDKITKVNYKDALLMNEYCRSKDPKADLQLAADKASVGRFLGSPDFKRLQQKFSEKYNIDFKEAEYTIIKAAWETCRVNSAYYSEKRHPSCGVIDEEDSQLWVKQDDSYWYTFVSPNSSPTNPKFGCGMAERLRTFLQSDRSAPSFAINVVHRSNNLVFHSILGLLPATEKDFRSTPFTVFNSNYTVVVFTNERQDLVGVYLNETLISVCTGPDGEKHNYCPFDQFVDLLKDYFDKNECEPYRCAPNGKPQDELPFCFSSSPF